MSRFTARTLAFGILDSTQRGCLPIVPVALKWVGNRRLRRSDVNTLSVLVILTGNSYPELAENIAR